MKKISLFFAVTILALGYYWYVHPSFNATVETALENIALPVVANASSAAGRTGKDAIAQQLAAYKVAAAMPIKSAIYQEYEKSPSLQVFFAKYGVDSAPPEAKFLAAKVILRDCKPFSFGYKTYRENLQSRLKPDEQMKEAQRAAIAQIEARCGGDWYSSPPSEDRANELMESASRAGSTAAAAFLIAQSDRPVPATELADKVGQYLASNDLATIEQAMRAILSAGNRTGPIPLTDGESANPYLFTNAWTLAMCDMGMDCGPDSLDVLASCGAGFCDVASSEDYIRLHGSTPSDFEKIMKWRLMIVANLFAGNKGKVGWNVFSKVKGS